MTTIFRKVMCSDRLPDKEGTYDTSKGTMYYIPRVDVWNPILVKFWFEPIEFPSGALKFVNAQSSDYHLGYNHGVDAVMELIKGGVK